MKERRFTGYTDKNGRQICEGDVLAWKNDDGAIIFNRVYFKDDVPYAETGIGEDMLLEEILPLEVEIAK